MLLRYRYRRLKARLLVWIEKRIFRQDAVEDAMLAEMQTYHARLEESGTAEFKRSHTFRVCYRPLHRRVRIFFDPVKSPVMDLFNEMGISVNERDTR